jgi:hypothetical protein
MTSLSDLPDLQSPCTEDASSLVLCQVPGGDTDLIWLSFALLLGGWGYGLTVRHLLVPTSISFGVILLISVAFFIFTGLFALLVVFGQEVVAVILFWGETINYLDV